MYLVDWWDSVWEEWEQGAFATYEEAKAFADQKDKEVFGNGSGDCFLSEITKQVKK